jgi:hypothetical protein
MNRKKIKMIYINIKIIIWIKRNAMTNKLIALIKISSTAEILINKIIVMIKMAPIAKKI